MKSQIVDTTAQYASQESKQGRNFVKRLYLIVDNGLDDARGKGGRPARLVVEVVDGSRFMNVFSVALILIPWIL